MLSTGHVNCTEYRNYVTERRIRLESLLPNKGSVAYCYMFFPFAEALVPKWVKVLLNVITMMSLWCAGSSGSATFTGLRPNRRLPFNFTVEGTGRAGERVVIFRTFRIGVQIIVHTLLKTK